MKKSINKAVVAAIVAAPAKPTVLDIEIKLPLGRPADPNSASYKRKMELQAKRESGVEVKRGRPSDPTSERQAKLAKIDEKVKSGAEIKRGRPSDPKSTRQQILQKRNERLEQLRAEAIAKKNGVVTEPSK